MDGATVTLIIAVITCIIGILTFISGRMSKAERDGRLAEKLDTCVSGISEIKAKLTAQDARQNQQNVSLENHEQRIVSVEKRLLSLEQRGGT